MKLLLHACCGPCTSGALEWLRGESPAGEITGLFYNPNIHPEPEYQRRRDTMERAGRLLELPLIWAGEDEGLVDYLQQVAFREADRCRTCYAMRLSYAAKEAAARNLDAFSTTLLISPYQNLESLQVIGNALSKLHGPDFLFHDLRPYYQLSRQRARELGLYRQKYCGCIFSELERMRVKTKRKEPPSPITDMPKTAGRPFTLPGLDPEATARLLETVTSPPHNPEEKWRPRGNG